MYYVGCPLPSFTLDTAERVPCKCLVDGDTLHNTYYLSHGFHRMWKYLNNLQYYDKYKLFYNK